MGDNGQMSAVAEQLAAMKAEQSALLREISQGFRRLDARLSHIETAHHLGGRGTSVLDLAAQLPGIVDPNLEDFSPWASARHASSGSPGGLGPMPSQHDPWRGFFSQGPGPVAESRANDLELEPPLRKALSAMTLEKASEALLSDGIQRRPSIARELPATSRFFKNFMGAEEDLEEPASPRVRLNKQDNHPDKESNGSHVGSRDEIAVAPKRFRSGCLVFLQDFWRQPIHPNSAFRTRWDLYILVLLVYVCITAPVVVCFDVDMKWNLHPLWWWEQWVTVMFILDIILNFNTAYLNSDDFVVTDRRRIAYNYSTGWLIVDVVAVLPYELMSPNQDVEAAQLAKGLRLAKFTRILRVLRVIKLLRVLKVPALLKRIEGVTGRGSLRSTIIMGGAVLITHLVACGFYYAAHLGMEDALTNVLFDEGVDYNLYMAMRSEEKFGYTEQAWMHTWVGTAGLATATSTERYVTALYWAMSTLTTVGYGDVTPANTAEKLCSMIAMILGVTIFAYFMGSTASLITAMNSTDTVVTRKLTQMDEFLRTRRVPKALTDRIRKFYNVAVQQQIVDDDQMVGQLSTPLRTELLLFLYRGTLEKVPFFKGQDPQFITSLVSKLRLEYYAEGDIVVREGDLGNVMYFVVRGILEARQYCFPTDGPEPEEEETSRRPTSADEPSTVGTERLSALRKSIMSKIALRSPDEVEAEHIPRQWRFYSNVRYLDHPYSLAGQLQGGEHFGEYSCLLGHPRTSTVVATEFSELYSLSRDDLMDVYRMWPELHQEFLDLVHQFQEVTGIREQGGSSVLPEVRALPQENAGTGEAFTTLDMSAQEPTGLGKKPVAETVIEAGQEDAREEISAVQQLTAISREKSKRDLKQTAKLMVNMKNFEKLSANPVFQLLNKGQDLKGMIDKQSRASNSGGEGEGLGNLSGGPRLRAHASMNRYSEASGLPPLMKTMSVSPSRVKESRVSEQETDGSGESEEMTLLRHASEALPSNSSKGWS
mmetsp:Transcript_40406/g.114405  ORF Transcript_40406/g.114405 Transcript_40406/m.114405 type:complete len:993 (-) Transcript_40406:789-3767(-)|eukprot:CAMPEP_0117662548 /NCGR_PEP_ID=MMETSP0804-20121206/8110_1 /TAXON_ID=1074897 /ORGANISM="Tetraselmis astigmatica, Strain CCMP880" /LENGTH=992 /DNA_ID=CAMNT_0005469451 /DNA_START=330 /DNA_END=3308 /DNA_ORIENTATION=-